MGSGLAKMVRQGCIGGFDRLQQGNHGCKATIVGQVLVRVECGLIKRHGSDAKMRIVAASVDHAGDGGCGR
ncbi:hypothetical protein ACFX15_046088 [Malus domestica]